jgi:hypothetical protein
LYHALGPSPKPGVAASKGFEIVAFSLLLVCVTMARRFAIAVSSDALQPLYIPF